MLQSEGARSEQPASDIHPENLGLSKIKLGGEDEGAGGVTAKTVPRKNSSFLPTSAEFEIRAHLPHPPPPVTFNSEGIKKILFLHTCHFVLQEISTR